MRKLSVLVLFLSFNFHAMGQYIGVYARKDGNLCFEKPLFTEEDAELNNKLRMARKELDRLREQIKLDQAYWAGMTFTESEIKALKCNYVQDNADDEINYARSQNTDLPPDFYAIGTKCNDMHCFVYDSKYLAFENWARAEVVKSGLIKMNKILHERIKANIQVTDYLLYDFENLNMLNGILDAIEELYHPDEIALIIAP